LPKKVFSWRVFQSFVVREECRAEEPGATLRPEEDEKKQTPAALKTAALH
jgi:hypothetical protein